MDKFGVWNRNIYGAHIAVCPNVPACLDEKNMQVSRTEIWKTLLVEHHSILPVKSSDLFCAGNGLQLSRAVRQANSLDATLTWIEMQGGYG